MAWPSVGYRRPMAGAFHLSMMWRACGGALLSRRPLSELLKLSQATSFYANPNCPLLRTQDTGVGDVRRESPYPVAGAASTHPVSSGDSL
jgi:hypothetical protein